MKNKYLLLTAALSLMAVCTVSAQEDTRDQLRSYSFVEAQGGLQMTATDADMTKLMTPTAAISFGHYFTPYIGLRLHINAWQSKAGFSDLDQYYKWKYVTPSADLMVNLTNLILKSPQHVLNVIFLGGVGLNYAWDNNELKDLKLPLSKIPMSWKDDKLSHNLRAGLRLETDVTKALGLSLEVAANSTDDRFNSKLNDADDWQFTTMLGVSYRFSKRYQKPAPILTPIIQEVIEDNSADIAPATPAIVEEKKPEPKAVVKTESLHEEIFYVICKSDPTEGGQAQLQRVADFMKKYKDAKVQIVGYADRGTGNPQINVMYAERRAAECKDALVNKYGCDAVRINIDSKGDTVQPFTENDKNRCVIIDSKAQYTVFE